MGFLRSAGKSLSQGQGIGGKVGGVLGHAFGGYGGALSSVDPTKMPRASDKGVNRVGGQLEAQGQAFANRNVPLYNPQQVTPTMVRGQQARAGEMGFLQDAVGVAANNVARAGQMDPRTMAFLQAAQQGGANTAQSLNLLRQAAMGQGPSAAQAQMNAGVDQAIKAQMAAAGSRGFNAAAMRGAQMQGAEMQQAAVNQAAMLRAQEMQAAQQAFMQGSLSQEDMARNAALAAGQTTLQQDVAGQQARQAAINAQLQGAGQFAGLGVEQALANAQLRQQAMLANQDVGLRAGMFNNQLGLDALALQQSGQLGFAGLSNQAFMGALGGQTAIMDADTQRLLQSGAARSKMIGGIFDAFGGKAMSSMFGGGAQAAGGAGAAGGTGAAGAAPAAAAASDKRGKTDIKPNKETESFLAALTDNQYRYKDPSKPGTAKGTQYGPMAQDLAKTKMGRTAVIDGPDGMMVDSARGFLLALSGLANINERLQKLEKR
jgi:hypothetical protein